jgi:hypothetical protein
LTGKLIARTEASHTHVEWLRFLKQIDRETPSALDLYRQLRHAQTSKGAGVARQASALHNALHADFFVLAQSGRTPGARRSQGKSLSSNAHLDRTTKVAQVLNQRRPLRAFQYQALYASRIVFMVGATAGCSGCRALLPTPTDYTISIREDETSWLQQRTSSVRSNLDFGSNRPGSQQRPMFYSTNQKSSVGIFIGKPIARQVGP